MSTTLSNRQQKYVDAIIATHGGTSGTYTRAELRMVSEAHGWKWIPNWITHDDSRRAARGVFNIPEAIVLNAPMEPVVETLTAEETTATMTA